MTAYLGQIFFLVIVGVASLILIKRIRRIRQNILLGKETDRNDLPSERWQTTLLVAFGQKKMFKRIVPAVFHLFIYIGFIVINLEVLEFVLDGLLGTHRLFMPYLGDVYLVAMNIFETLAVLVIVACVVFLWRRNIQKVRRFQARELTAWPKLDANLILVIEIVLMFAILTMNAADQVLQTRPGGEYATTGTLFFSSILSPGLANFSTPALVFIERFAWWFHIVGILGFAIYITYSKHLHIFLAFPNTYFSRLVPKGKMDNMPAVTKEVQIMLGATPESEGDSNAEEIGRFGAKDVGDLFWTDLMGAYACSECGRCTDECPANQTGKKLSPRKIMMDTRDRLEGVGKKLDKGEDGLADGKTLLDDFISREELNACTTCNACVEACPININPLSIILQMRRYIAMEEAKSPASWNAMYSNIENNLAPWKFSPSDRFNWAEEMTSENTNSADQTEEA